MTNLTAADRRARLGVRHALTPAHRASSPADVARALVGVHGTDPASTMLSILARCPGATPESVEHAMYEERSVVRVLAMRRTVFAVARESAATMFAAAGGTVARQQRQQLAKMLTDNAVTDDPETWIRQAEDAVLEAFADDGELTAPELAATHPLLGTRLLLAPGTRYETTTSAASRLLTLMSAEGSVVRTRPRGGWTSTQFRWSSRSAWLGDEPSPGPDEAAVELARHWLRRHGPATPDDLQWWAGWTKTRTRAALTALDTTEVTVDGEPALLLTDDLEPVHAPDPWVALLPALDATAMTWKQRDFCLGPHRSLLYDVNGNAGPTVWADGRVVGGWAQRDGGEVVVRLLDDIGTETAAAVDERAAELTSLLGDVRLKARARGWTPVEKELRA